mmetsp:Transcript_2634/g.3366  ORF Transcript_2634/g.3366 Transcript_2634/m.3366 type:complete len:125 (-) Transcript_2634:65-439(-)
MWMVFSVKAWGKGRDALTVLVEAPPFEVVLVYLMGECESFAPLAVCFTCAEGAAPWPITGRTGSAEAAAILNEGFGLRPDDVGFIVAAAGPCWAELEAIRGPCWHKTESAESSCLVVCMRADSS